MDKFESHGMGLYPGAGDKPLSEHVAIASGLVNRQPVILSPRRRSIRSVPWR